MSKYIGPAVQEFELGDIVEFTSPDDYRIKGEVVRVYNTRDLYHVKVDGSIYEVSIYTDNPRKIA